MNGTAWMAHGACVDSDRDVFFPTPGDAHADQPAAVAICRGCPVRSDCLQWAVEMGITEGVWGGRVPSQRKANA